MEIYSTNERDKTPPWESMATHRRYPCYTSEIEQQVLWRALSLIPNPTIALDIGCEGGRWSKLLADRGWSLTCIDIDQQSLMICKQRIPTATCLLVNPDDSHLPCDSESVGLVLCIEVPNVIESDWFITEAFRVLQKDGLLVGMFFNQESWRGWMHHLIAPIFYGSVSLYRLAYPAWRRRLEKKGFRLLHEEAFGWFPFRKSSDSPLVPVFAHLERSLGLQKLVTYSPLLAFIAQKRT